MGRGALQKSFFITLLTAGIAARADMLCRAGKVVAAAPEYWRGREMATNEAAGESLERRLRDAGA